MSDFCAFCAFLRLKCLGRCLRRACGRRGPAGRWQRGGALTLAPAKVHLPLVKDTYSIKELQRETAAAVRSAESGALVTITRHDRPVVHVLSAERLSGMLETMELLADPVFMRQLKRLQTGKLKFHRASCLAD